MKRRIAVVYGGYSGESVISKKSATMVLNNIDKSKFDPIAVEITKNHWKAHLDGAEYTVDKNDFSITTTDGKLTFNKVFNIIHGSPGEDGLLQGYFQMLDIPHTTSDVFTMSLTFNKAANNTYLRQYGFNCAKSFLLKKTDHYSVSKIVTNLGLPCFVKPNEGGSSLGISKVSDSNTMASAIELAFKESEEVIIEEFISGREVTCGVITRHGTPHALPITEIIADGDWFDFEAKYEGASKEVTPADIPEELSLHIKHISEEIYTLLKANGMIRVDYLLNEKGPYLIEVNSVPGFSEVSIIPQQAAKAGISKKELITILLEES